MYQRLVEDGLASKLLDADTEGIVLEIHPMPSGGLTRKESASWYRQYGFQWEKSRIEPKVLIREPKEYSL